MFKRRLLGMVLLVGMLFGQSVPHAFAAAYCDHAQFVSDLTAPDGASFAPGAAFTKTWRFMNIGTCTWTQSYSIVYAGGDAMGAPLSVKLPVTIAPGQMLDISVKLTAPLAPGHYKGLWKFSNAIGVQFGIGDSAGGAFWVDINVIENKAVIYDFVVNAPYAQWKSGAGALPFPVSGGDDRGYAYQVSNPHLEDDSFDPSPGLMTVPQNKYNGYIQATYPELQIQQGDQLQTLVNCEFAATSCYAIFRVDYLLPNNAQRTLWSWKETYDKRFYRANISLNALAGQRVRFVFMVLATGYGNGDRALWGSPRIVRTGGTLPPAPPPTLTLLPPLTPTLTPIAPPPPTIPPLGCDRATFVTDVTIPDGTLFAPATTFTKTWRLKNSGSCTWTTAYKLMFYSGEQMGGPSALNIPRIVYAGQTIDLAVNLTAPAFAGTYRGYWILSNASGALFGLGTDASKPFWVEVNVSGTSPVVSGYNFVLNACSAQWKSGAGILPCPGTDGDSKGYVIDRQFTQLEDGNMGPAPSILIAPELKYNGYIQGTYPLFTVLPGDRFVGSTGCAYGSSCYVTFRLDYMTSTGAIKTFWTWRESSDSKNNPFDLNLSPLAGQSVRFILTILATGSATNDRAVWTAPYIVRLDQSQIPPTVTPTHTPITMPGTIVPSPLIRKLYMLDSFNGWAIGDSYLLRTNDGGTTWYNVTMPGVSFVGNGFFQNADRGWVISGNSLYRTTDGGRAWTQYSVPFNGGYIQFLNDANGFVLSGEPSGMQKHAVSLYQTSDGGATWTLKYANDPTVPNNPLPFSGHKNGMTFRDTVRGWVGGDYPAEGYVYLYKTIDSGSTWSQQPLILPYGYGTASITIESPKFFGANDAILPVWMSTNTSRDLFIYVTRDGGNTWARSAGMVPQGKNTDFVSKNDGFTWNWNGYFQVTHNSGTSWNQVTPNVNFGDNVRDLDFVSNTTGWLVQNNVNGITPLYRTSDGGSTWTLLSGSPSIPVPILTTTPSTPTQTPVPVVTSLNAKVTADKLSCRYGPGAEYLYLYALNQTANIKLIGRTDANNWVWVDGTNKCWVNASFLEIAGDPKTLPIVYPGTAKLPVSPYYPAPAWASAVRNGNSVGVTWAPVVVSAGDYEDEFMNQYILEVWRCEAGQIIFETLGSNLPSIVVAKDEAGCNVPSYGRIFVQEKHGYAGPVEVPWPPSTTSTPTPVPAAFAQSIVDALNARNFDAAKARMDQIFATGYWGSQGTASTPDQAIEAFRSRYLGTAPLTSNASKDLTFALGGMNPYAIMGLDPAKSYALFVSGFSGWSVAGKTEAILYVTRRADGSLYWFGMLMAPDGFESAPTATPGPLIGPYAVIRVAQNDVLNIRAGAGVNFLTVGSFPPDATNVMKTGSTQTVGGSEWVEVQNPSGGTGWVNSFYLTEYVSHDAFCADTRIAALIEQLKGSMNQSNGDMFSALVSPKHGVDVHLWAYQSAVNFSPSLASGVFASTEVYNWGAGPRGEPDFGTFSQIIQPKALDTLNAPNMETYCDSLTKVFPLSRPWPEPSVRFYHLYKPGTPGTELDFRTWLVGFEYINNQPYLYKMVHIVWEP